MTTRTRAGLTSVWMLSAMTVGAQQPPAPPAQPTFRASTELIAIDATVVTDRGEPVADLRPEDFVLTIDGSPRRVVSAQFIKQEPPGPAPKLAGRKLPFTTNESAVGGRLILIVFDLEGIGVGGGRGATVAASRFLDKLAASDRVGVLAFPNGANVDFTTDREKLKQALQRVVGRGSVFENGLYNIGLSEAFDIDRGDPSALERVVQRECAGERTPEGLDHCRNALQSQARSTAMVSRQRGVNSLQALRAILQSFAKIDAPKTVVWISEGLALAEDRVEIGGMAAMAAAARTTIYSLHLDQTIVADASRGRSSPSMMQDRQLAIDGLATIAGITRGSMFTSIGTGGNVFEHIAREMTAYYLLSAEPEAQDRDGKSHRIKVAVNRKDLNIRARREFTLRKEAAVPPSPAQRLAGILQQPLLATELPIKVATYNLRTPGASTVKVVVTTEFGRNATAEEDATVAYVVLTDTGKVAGTSIAANKATPVRSGTAGPLQATTVVEVLPGHYVLRLAVLDANGRAGSVEHQLDAGLSSAGDVELADLLLAPANAGTVAAVRLVADPTIEDEPFGAYLELYPKSPGAMRQAKVTIEVADSDTTPAIASADAAIGETREKQRYVAQAPLPLGLVPPGEYVARAVVVIGGTTSVQLRPFKLARAVPAGQMFKTDLSTRVGNFQRGHVLTAALLAPAITRARELSEAPLSEPLAQLADEVAAGHLDTLVPTALGDDVSLTSVFLRGLARYRAGSLEEAAQDFRAAVRKSPDFLPGIFYLGACYAAGGHGREAVGAWQTSLVGDDSSPDVFQILIDGFLRLGDTDAAIGAIEEAAAKWPEDYRFVLRATLAQAAQDKPAEALQRLLPWLDRNVGDPEALDLALRLALADLATRPAGSEQDAITRLKALTSRYEASGTPVPPVAARWLAYLAARTPTAAIPRAPVHTATDR
jgi:VWFA-related protein